MTAGETTGPSRRLALVDMLRGAAILAMIAYHFAWDLSYYGFYGADLIVEPGWVLFQKAILSSFLLLVGAGLVLAHGEAIRWAAFWRRFGVLVASALAVTLGTWWMFPDYFVYFGILHAIAAFSLLALAFLRLPTAAVLAAALVFILPPLILTFPGFHVRGLAWIGFWSRLPDTTDIVPVFPWFGVVLLGIAGGRLLARRRHNLVRIEARSPPARFLARAGRWSLVIYLVHQPLLLALLWLAAMAVPPPAAPDRRDADFRASCEANCAGGTAPGQCTAYCACALEAVREGELWETLARPGPERDAAVAGVEGLCRALR